MWATIRCSVTAVVFCSLFASIADPVRAAPPSGVYAPEAFRERPSRDEIIYFLLPDRFENADLSNDRGGLRGDRLVTGFDPTAKGFFHGGDLKGVISRLDYIQALGGTAIWLGAIFKNQTVQGTAGGESAGYHGYWITDFTQVDPHFGSNADLRSLVAAAHALGIKIYLDIVVNHTADVIGYRECPTSACSYRSRADYPYTRRGGATGVPINDGFAGDGPMWQTAENFSKLSRSDYAYTPFVPESSRHLKVPDWLNDPIYYHNRGNSDFRGESASLGDFGGLDDLMTESPRVVDGFIEIYGRWIDEYGIDGFRIDTAKHVNPEFWQKFVPAMLARAAAKGIRNFHIFGEVQSNDVDSALLARHTRIDGLPAVLDFAFAGAVRDTVAGQAGTDLLAELFANDALYEGGTEAALQLPTFISNHDDGRFAFKVRAARPAAADAEVLARVALGYAMLFTLRGVPTVYYGDEQGFVGGADKDGREDMFASRTADYYAEHLIGTDSNTAHGSFNPRHPLYLRLSELAALRRAHAALRSGGQVVRFASHVPGLFAVSRFDPADATEIVVIFNTSADTLNAQIEVDSRSTRFRSLRGSCAAAPTAPASYAVSVAGLDYLICAAERH